MTDRDGDRLLGRIPRDKDLLLLGSVAKLCGCSYITVFRAVVSEALPTEPRAGAMDKYRVRRDVALAWNATRPSASWKRS
jgi:hypothetical protein